MVNVVDYWVSQQMLRETGGQGQLAARVEDLVAGVPESLRQMIEQQVGRLTPEERRLIEAVSVAEIEFSAAAVAAGVEEQTTRIEEVCEGGSQAGTIPTGAENRDLSGWDGKGPLRVSARAVSAGAV